MSDGVKCTQSWLGDDDFWFYHWEAEHEDLIHKKLTEVGTDGLFFYYVARNEVLFKQQHG